MQKQVAVPRAPRRAGMARGMWMLAAGIVATATTVAILEGLAHGAARTALGLAGLTVAMPLTVQGLTHIRNAGARGVVAAVLLGFVVAMWTYYLWPGRHLELRGVLGLALGTLIVFFTWRHVRRAPVATRESVHEQLPLDER